MSPDQRRAICHELKTVQPFFDDVVKGRKTFEVRRNDRDFRVGDMLLLREWDPSRDTYVAHDGLREMLPMFDVVYVYAGELALPGHVVMGIRPHTLCRRCLVSAGRTCRRCVRCVMCCACDVLEIAAHMDEAASVSSTGRIIPLGMLELDPPHDP